MKLKWIKTCFFAVSLLGMALPTALAVTFTGSLSTATSPAGLSGTGVWANNFKITWTVEEQTNSTWKYIYDLTQTDGSDISKGEVSHVIIEVSPNVQSSDFWDFAADGISFGNDPFGDKKVAIDTYTGTSHGNSNPGLPGSLFGIKLDVSDGTTYSFFSSRAPVWGDWYSKNGTAGSLGQNAIWNTDILALDPNPLTNPPQNGLPSDGQGGSLYKILRPDTTTFLPGPTPNIPEPGTVLLFGLGLGVAAFFRSRRD